MKAGMNGVLNISIPDGWVPEGIRHGQNGWLFGKGDSNSTAHDREELFKLREETVLPLYYEWQLQDKKPSKAKKDVREESAVQVIPYSPNWIRMMKESVRTITAQFGSERMLVEYIEKMYLPGLRAAAQNPARVGQA